MTDQPTPGNDEAPKGHQPPSYPPLYGSEVPPAPPGAPHVQEPGYSTHEGQHYGLGAPAYGQPAAPYGSAPSGNAQGGSAYGVPGQQPYGAPQQYGSPQQYGPPGSAYNVYGQPAYYGMPPEPKGLSIASMCCGIAAFVGFGFFILPQIAAVILGHLALKREPGSRGMAIAGLVMGYVAIALTIAVIVIFAAVAGSARNRGYGV